jgi:hypothetical protein
MKLALITPLLLLTASVTAEEHDLATQASDAYKAKQYTTCAKLHEQRAVKDPTSAEPSYNAACCHALAGDKDLAFAALDRLAKLGYTEPDVVADADFASLRADPRWAKLVAAIDANVARFEKTMADPKLRRELLAMVQVDQAARMAFIAAHFKDAALAEKARAVDKKNTARMKEIVAAKGWPGKSLVGKDGASAAWLLVQHADLDVPFQKLCLARMEPMLKTGEIEAKDYAYLVDRVAVAEKRKQTYGTQLDEHHREPWPIEDEAHVDERRKSVGLGTMAEYRAEMRRVYGPPPASDANKK